MDPALTERPSRASGPRVSAARTGVAVSAAVCALAVAAASCESTSPPAAPSPAALEPHWQDAFAPLPPVLLSFRPAALQADPLYGPLLRKALAVVRLRSPAVAATHAIEAIEDADEVVCGLRPGPGDALDRTDLVVAVLGVRADIDPATLIDASGRPLWTAGPLGRARELVRAAPSVADALDPAAPDGVSVDASLFELPGRTWVIASGHEAARAREAFSRPRRHPEVPVDDSALAVLRIDGPALATRIPFLRGRGALAPVGRHLRFVSIAIPGAERDAGAADSGADPSDVSATLAYADAPAADAAHDILVDAVSAIARTRPQGLAWLASVRVAPRSASSSDVALTLPLPLDLMAALRDASAPPRAPAADAGETRTREKRGQGDASVPL